jgi:hypothetical protein
MPAMSELSTRRPLWTLSADEASLAMARRECGSEDLVRACLARIAQREPEVQAWAHLDAENALAQARARDREPRRSPLHGIPVGVKDIIRTRDLPTTFNSPVYEGFNAAEDEAQAEMSRKVDVAYQNGRVKGFQLGCDHQKRIHADRARDAARRDGKGRFTTPKK